MTKSKDQRGKQPNRSRKRARPTIEEKPPVPLTVTIAAAPDPAADDASPSLAGDVQLVKAAALYADQIELISPVAAMLVDVARHRDASDSSQLWQVMSALSDAEIEAMVPSGGGWSSMPWRTLIPQLEKHPEIAEQFGIGDAINQLRQGLFDAQGETRKIAEGLLEGSGVDELLPFVEAGVLTVSSFPGADTSSAVRAAAGTLNEFEFAVDVATGWLNAIQSRLNDGTSRLLFDAQSRAVAHELLDVSNPVHGLTARLAGEASIGSGLMARLDSFPTASVDEILDLRSRLNVARLRYRRAVAGFAEKLPSGLDDLHGAELERLWQAEVRPALAELEQTLHESGFKQAFVRAAGDDAEKVVGGGTGIFIGLHSMTSLHEAAALAATVAAPSAGVALRALRSSQEAARKGRAHDLYYLHAANSTLT